ncbi:MAG TPA: hypothetical protein PLR99_18010 [Polyangiaceae bacterium]|nr:hypothetical protein [Polyangiaceae bacterium]
MRPRLPFLILLAFCLTFSAVGCPCLRGPINASPGIRWWLFATFGASRVCPELVKRGAPLKLGSLGSASVGRFFPTQCDAQVDGQRQTMLLRVTGTGYANLPVARRVGFQATVAVEYAPDFYLADDDSTYVWGKFTRLVTPPDLRIIGVENPVVNLATQTPLGNVATVLGQGIMTGEIGRGFTVVRQADGDDFAMGHLDPPAKPPRQFKTREDHASLASDLTEIRSLSREYLGPFEVPGDGLALSLRSRLQGSTLVYSVVDRASGDAWRRAYESAGPLGPPFIAPLHQGQLPVGEGTQTFPVPAGQYFIVLENRTPPPLIGLGVGIADPVATLGYSVELGARP